MLVALMPQSVAPPRVVFTASKVGPSETRKTSPALMYYTGRGLGHTHDGCK